MSPATRRTVAAVVLSLLIPCLMAATYKGIEVPDTFTLSGTQLELNGYGIRTVTLLKVKLYIMALYLEARSADADAIIASKGTKRVWQYYMREVGAERIQKGWRESLAEHNESLAGIEKECEQFTLLWEDVKKGTRVTVDFVEDRVEVSVDGRKKPAVEGTAFQKALLNVWLGPKVTDHAVKTAILGKAR